MNAVCATFGFGTGRQSGYVNLSKKVLKPYSTSNLINAFQTVSNSSCNCYMCRILVKGFDVK